MRAFRTLALMVFAVILASPGVAWAQGVYTGTPVPVAGNVDTGVAVLPASGARTAQVLSTQNTSGLAFTGTDILALLVISAGFVVVGMVLVRRTRAT